MNVVNLDARELVPELMKNEGSLYVFNPSIVKNNKDGFHCVYRVVDGNGKRKIASCQLTHGFDVVKGSIVLLSDKIQFADKNVDERQKDWHADPRLFLLGERLFVLWNDGHRKPSNSQFILELDSETLLPVGSAKELVIKGESKSIQKNWMLFEDNGSYYAIHSLSPLKILNVDLLNEGNVVNCSVIQEEEVNNSYEGVYGELRGGAQPVKVGKYFYKVAHSSFKSENGKQIYMPCFVKFEVVDGKVNIVKVPKYPINIEGCSKELFNLKKLNKKVESVIYPCGLCFHDGKFLVSFGVNDERSSLCELSIDEVEYSLEPIFEPSRAEYSDFDNLDSKNEIPVFYWNPVGKRFNNGLDNRTFRKANVGDLASKLFVERISGMKFCQSTQGKNKLLCIGSILHTANDGDVVWGTGVKGNVTGFKNEVSNLDVHAVRGPLTYEFLRKNNIKTDSVKAFFDPGCLVPRLYENELSSVVKNGEMFPFLIIPHYKDELTLKINYPQYAHLFLSVDEYPLEFCRRIKESNLVISSSLHGIIFAEALGVPAVWLEPIHGEDQMKYYDYYFGTSRMRVKKAATIEQALKIEPMELPVFDFEHIIGTFPKKQLIEKFTDVKSIASQSSFDILMNGGVELSSIALSNSIVAFKREEFFDGIVSILQALYFNESFVKKPDVEVFISLLSHFIGFEDKDAVNREYKYGNRETFLKFFIKLVFGSSKISSDVKKSIFAKSYELTNDSSLLSTMSNEC